MKKIVIGIAVLVVLVGGGWFLLGNKAQDEVAVSSPQNATYLINEESFTLVNGLVEKEITSDSAVKNKVSVFGEPAYGDIDGDGDEDAVLILVNEPGGSGTFYYAAIAVNDNGEFKGTDAILLGDRIAPQTYYMEGNKAIVNYVDRAPGEDFSVQPSIGKSLYLQFNKESYRLIQIAVDFEGEADPNVMTLDMKTWKWIKTIYNNDTELAPKNKEAFTLTFKDGKFSATTDCNSMSGAYEVNDKKIAFKDAASTLKYCEGSQEVEFSKMLDEIQSFFFTGKGELIFELKVDSGSAIFK